MENPFVLSSFSGIMLPVTGFSILDICFIFFLWHSVACFSGFSILIICSNIKNGESRVTANTIPEKEHKTNIKNGESRVTGNTMTEKEDKTNIRNGESDWILHS
jgi:hypothetical protein